MYSIMSSRGGFGSYLKQKNFYRLVFCKNHSFLRKNLRKSKSTSSITSIDVTVPRRDATSNMKPLLSGKVQSLLSGLEEKSLNVLNNLTCIGCGTTLQYCQPETQGFVPVKKLMDLVDQIKSNTVTAEDGSISIEKSSIERPICQRCFYLKHYNTALKTTLPHDEYKSHLSYLKEQRALVVCIVDIVDFPSSLFPELYTILNPQCTVYIVANKMDIFPSTNRKSFSRLESYILQEATKSLGDDIKVSKVFYVSAKTGQGIESLSDSIVTDWGNRGDIYLIGCTNVGKSSMFNHLLYSLCGVKPGQLVTRNKMAAPSPTISHWPGTTLGLISFPIMSVGKRRRLIAQAQRDRKELEDIIFERNEVPDSGSTLNLWQDFVDLPSSIDSDPSSIDSDPSSIDSDPSSIDSDPSSIDSDPSSIDSQPSSIDSDPSSIDSDPSSIDSDSSSIDSDSSSIDSDSSSIDSVPDSDPSSIDSDPSSIDSDPSSIDSDPSSIDSDPSSIDSHYSLSTSLLEVSDVLDELGLKRNKKHMTKREIKKEQVLEQLLPDNRFSLYDTPGAINNLQVVNDMTTRELNLVLPKRRLSPRTFILKPGHSMFIGGLARLDYLEGNVSTFFSVFACAYLPVHITQVTKADDVYKRNLGKSLFKVPTGDIERLNSFPSLEGIEFVVNGIGWNQCACDIILSSVGWVGVTLGVDERAAVKCYTPQGKGMFMREPSLFPSAVTERGKRSQKGNKTAFYNKRNPSSKNKIRATASAGTKRTKSFKRF